MRSVGYAFAIVAAIAAASQIAFDLSNAGRPAVFLIMGAPTVAIAAIGLVRARRDGELREWLSVRGGDFTRGFVAAALLFGLAFAFTKLVAPPTSPQASWLARLYLQLGDPSVLRRNVPAMVAAIVVMSVGEEIVWRGLVPSLLAPRLGSRRAWVYAAVLYALAHAPAVWKLADPVAGPNPVLPLGALGGGLVWGLMASRFRRLLPGIFSHVLFDWTVMMMFRLWGPSV